MEQRKKAKEEAASSVSADPEVRKMVTELRAAEGGPEDPKAMEEKLFGFVKMAMKRDNVSNLFQTPKLRQHETSTASSYQNAPGKEYFPNKEHNLKRNAYSDYTEDYIRFKHTMR